MAEASQQTDGRALSARALLPPYVVVPDFLPGDMAAGLLAHALATEPQFEPARVGSGAHKRLDPARRVAALSRDLGAFAAPLRARLHARLPDFIARLRLAPVADADIELQLVAHGDGAFYDRHIDTRTSPDESTRWLRVLSAVYYFHARPQAFSGGALRLFAFGRARDARFVDVAPTDNTLLVFPSWAPHQVMPVRCPSRRFVDSRFAVNCWYRVPARAVG